MVIPNLPESYAFDSEGLLFGKQRISNYIVIPRKVFHRPNEETPYCCSLSVLIAGQREQSLGEYFKLADMTKRWWKTPPSYCWIYPGAVHADGHLALVFNALLQELPLQEIVLLDTLGWHTLSDGTHVYAAGTDVIGARSEAYISVSDELKQFTIERVPNVSAKDALQYFWRLYHLVPGISNVLLTTTVASFLMPMFRSAGLHSWFSVMLEGETESKKTTLATLTSGLYRRVSAPRSCVLSLTSTGPALERSLGRLRHCTGVCDDLFPDGGVAQMHLVLNLIRDQANQNPRESVSGNSVRSYPRESGLVFTVEKVPLCCQSTSTRCLRLVLDEPISNSRIATVQRNSALLGNVWYLFLKRAAARYAELEQLIRKEFSTYRAKRLNYKGPERLPEIEAILYISMECFLRLFPAPDSKKRLDELSDHLDYWTKQSCDQNTLPRAILELHDNVPDYFIDYHGCWCITRETLTTLLQEYFDTDSLDPRTVTALLSSQNMLQMDKSNERTKKVCGVRRLCIIPERLMGLE